MIEYYLIFLKNHHHPHPHPTSIIPSLESSGDSESIFSSWPIWIFIILFVAFLGFNIFSYLAKGTQETSDMVFPLWTKILSIFGNQVKDTGREIVHGSAQGTESVANEIGKEAAEIKDSTNSPPEDTTTNPRNINPETTQQPTPDNAQHTALNRALNTPSPGINQDNSEGVEPSDASTTKQRGKAWVVLYWNR